jgi:hypothetical protein
MTAWPITASQRKRISVSSRSFAAFWSFIDDRFKRHFVVTSASRFRAAWRARWAAPRMGFRARGASGNDRAYRRGHLSTSPSRNLADPAWSESAGVPAMSIRKVMRYSLATESPDGFSRPKSSCTLNETERLLATVIQRDGGCQPVIQNASVPAFRGHGGAHAARGSIVRAMQVVRVDRIDSFDVGHRETAGSQSSSDCHQAPRRRLQAKDSPSVRCRKPNSLAQLQRRLRKRQRRNPEQYEYLRQVLLGCPFVRSGAASGDSSKMMAPKPRHAPARTYLLLVKGSKKDSSSRIMAIGSSSSISAREVSAAAKMRCAPARPVRSAITSISDLRRPAARYRHDLAAPAISHDVATTRAALEARSGPGKA